MEQNFTPHSSTIRPNFFEQLAFILAISSLFSSTFIYLSYLLGGLAVLFALLSRGGRMKLSRKSKLSIFIGILGIVFSTLLFVGSFLILLREYGSLEGILRASSEMMGLNFEQEFGYLFE